MAATWNEPITLDAIRETHALIAPHVRRTPVMRWRGDAFTDEAGDLFDAYLKMELFQVTGTFKVRGVLSVLSRLSVEDRARGATGFSAGNHAIAVAYGARALGMPAKVVMLETANPARVRKARQYGAEVLVAADGASASAMAEEIVASDGMAFVHPFEGRNTVLGTGTLGLEMCEQIRDVEAVVVGIGGGGLAAGVAAAVKLHDPNVRVYGVEPEGAACMTKSFAEGGPVTWPVVRTIADSLAPPFTTPYTFGVCRDYVDDIVTVSDDALMHAMRLLFDDLKLVVEPGGVAAVAAALGPLKSRLAGKKVVLALCGSNIDLRSFSDLTGL
ncbi:MAG: pyridoxal-phosphate dependent enzyme [Alphaproteobacteria bacterium]|nr:MAG: pyridoxal-phosphate dependent enzyme [Alphaproteobacteria bacterium]